MRWACPTHEAAGSAMASDTPCPLHGPPPGCVFRRDPGPRCAGGSRGPTHGGPSQAEGRPRESAQPGCGPASVNEIPHHPPSEWGHQATWDWTSSCCHHTRIPLRPALHPSSKERHVCSGRPGPRAPLQADSRGKGNVSQLKLGCRPQSPHVFPGSWGLGPAPHMRQCPGQGLGRSSSLCLLELHCFKAP